MGLPVGFESVDGAPAPERPAEPPIMAYEDLPPGTPLISGVFPFFPLCPPLPTRVELHRMADGQVTSSGGHDPLAMVP